MLTLAIETSCREGGAALLRDGELIGETSMDTRLNHSAALLPVVEGLLERCGAGREEIGGIGVDVGPGSFTGIRVGIAAALGLARGLDVPVSGVTSLEALVSDDSSGAPFLFPVVDARGGRLFGALFERRGDGWKRLAEIRLLEPGGIAGSLPRGTRIIGPGLSAFREALEEVMGEGGDIAPGERYPSASAVARLAERNILEGRPSEPEPVYLRSYVKKKAAT